MKKTLLLLSLLAASFSGLVQADDAAIQQSLMKLGVKKAEIQPSPISGLKTVLTDGSVLYVSEDGKHVIDGTLYDVSGAQPVNVTNKMLMTKLNGMKDEMIIYKAPNEQHTITVFTDITCGYCHKLHEQIKDYNALGITVRYLAFPRQGLQSQSERDMKAVWCAKDRKAAFDNAMKGGDIPPATCDIDLSRQYKLGAQFGIQGTPAIVLDDGNIIPGYQGPSEMKKMLDAHKKIAESNG